MNKLRIDKWLWAARFFKTRGLAMQAIENGKVLSNGQRLKPSKEINTGLQLSIQQGWDWKDIEVISLSEQRRSALEAQAMYIESQSSIDRRERNAEQRKILKGAHHSPEKRPTKKQRRQIHRFKNAFS